MPITRRQESKKGDQTPSTTEESTSATTATTSATEASGSTESTATGTVTSEQTTTTMSSSVRSAPAIKASAKTSAAAFSTTPSAETTVPADVSKLAPPTAPAIVQRGQDIETSTIRKKKTEKPREPRMLKKPHHSEQGAGSTCSRSKAHRIAKAREELLRIQVELAAARLATLEHEPSSEDEVIEEDGASVHTSSEANERVDNWLENHQTQPLLAISDAPHHVTAPAIPIQGHVSQPEPQRHRSPAGEQPGLADLAEAITRAVKAAQRPKFIELPYFGGAQNEWLPFRAAYFETATEYTAVENTNRLRRNLKGIAREAVERLLITSAPPADIMRILESRFGRPESIAIAEIEALRALPRLNESPRDICIYSTKVANIVATLKALNCGNYLHNPEIAKTVIEKFTATLRFRYYDFEETQPREDPELVKIDKFLQRTAEQCGRHAHPEQITPQQSTVKRQAQRVHSVAEKTDTDRTYNQKCPVCTEEHNAPECEKFKNLDVNARWETAKSKHLCFRCLRVRSKVHRCKTRLCGINECRNTHNKMLHSDRPRARKEEDEATEAINSAWTVKRKQSYLKVIPVKIKGPKETIDTYALLDDGSTITLLDSSVADRIGAKGPVDPLKIEGINNMKTSELSSKRVTIELRGLNGNREKIQARTINNLQVSSQRVSQEMVNDCKHLADIRNHLVYAEVKPQILIGQDNWHLLLASDVKKGNHSQPVASLTPLGWVLHGSRTRTIGRSINFISHITEKKEDDIDTLVKQYFEMDALCIQPNKPKSDPEEKALRILENTTRKLENGRFETGLLWSKEDVKLPDNYENSLKRLVNIEKKIDRNPRLKQRYSEQMEALVTKGYAELAPKQKRAGKTWYLPHFAVINPMKPEKLRVVHDAAAKTKGVALNDMLLKGPDLLQTLPGVIMRFRQHKIAVTADIKEMFMQVKLRTEDRDALRYLWRDNRRDNQPPEEYRMTSLVFGASSSPSTAIYIKNLNANQHKATHPEAAAAIIKKHYVDDYLDSFQTIEDAIRITKEVREVHARASFELKQWKSNSTELIEALDENEQVTNIELHKSEEKTERVLGIGWSLKTDELTFNLDLTRIASMSAVGKAPTKREALRIVMSLFDPLGFASPVTAKAKQLLQEVWRRGTSWDETIDQDLAEQWDEWMKRLKNLSNVRIPRRYLSYSDAATLQLHIFSDASEVAYSTVLFWRTIAPNGDISVSHIAAKAKVAPLKLTSIPRLELQAAVMGTRLTEVVLEEHERKPDNKFFWTDSKTVLSWIRTGSRSYKPYVAHRIAAIEEASKVSEWRWVPTKQNVADDATRDVPADFNADHRWYRGPDFLYEPEANWPVEAAKEPRGKEPSGEERTHHVSEEKKLKLSEALPDVSRFSNWDRLRFTTARVLQFIALCKTSSAKVHYKRTRKNEENDPNWKRTPKPTVKIPKRRIISPPGRTFHPVSGELLRKAEELLMRSSQEMSFADDIEKLKKEKTVSKEGRLHQLSVVYADGAIRLRSRIKATIGITEKVKSPIVVNGDHPTVKLWINAVHRELHHAGVEATINECRQQYWVLRLRPTTRVVIRRCLFCRMKTASPPFPRTGDLPACRLAHHKRPFTFTGVDYFGPLSVTVGRTKQKRYVAIFTCLTMRAVHLEIAGSLSADSAVMALRRMMARRGRPFQIWSDNGTNLKAADRELRRAIDAATAEEAAKKTISWRYIPPGAPFMGGAWERLVRSVKTALAAALHERHPTEEVLSTLLAEAEYTVNSRPLTHVSVNPEDPDTLTPNHFLLGGPGRVPQPGVFNEKDDATRSTWRATQRLADIFWTRWVREYLPELQHRREPHGRGPPVKTNDLVQIIDANLPRNTWVRGRVIATYPGPDNIVRTVDIKTRGGVLRRAVRKLVILPIETGEPAPKSGFVENERRE